MKPGSNAQSVTIYILINFEPTEQITLQNLTVYRSSSWRKSHAENSKYFVIRSRITDFELE